MSEVEQYVCTVCGYNMVGYHPENCPFCGASKTKFISAEQCTSEYDIEVIEISKEVARLNSTPSLGLEHAAYRIDTGKKRFWIDCPSTFKKEVDTMDAILFTHHHFLGASNLYHTYFDAEVWIHKKDSLMSLAAHHSFTNIFEENFSVSGIDAFHIDGHTRGFTFYIFKDILFECDYTFYSGQSMKYNPYGNRERTKEGGEKMNRIIEKYTLTNVCGVDYVVDFSEWYPLFQKLLE
ncbi:MAG: hypothetical protein BAJALOKI1v1_1880002 [Promethearchaeota archaeon]|nr:MAG: hypothetical protein BAJALOKI1v1_1880002 [Candidatus Lokiarchaeota archaeon]